MGERGTKRCTSTSKCPNEHVGTPTETTHRKIVFDPAGHKLASFIVYVLDGEMRPRTNTKIDRRRRQFHEVNEFKTR